MATVTARRGEFYYDHYVDYIPTKRTPPKPIIHESNHDYDDYDRYMKPDSQTVGKTAKKTASRAKKQVYVHTRGEKLSLWTWIAILYIFAGILACLVLYVLTGSKHNDILSAQNDLKYLKEYNASLAADISGSYDLTEIEKIATTKLGMIEPKEHQIIHISVPKQSYVIQNEKNNVIPEKENSLAIVIKDIFAKD